MIRISPVAGVVRRAASFCAMVLCVLPGGTRYDKAGLGGALWKLVRGVSKHGDGSKQWCEIRPYGGMHIRNSQLFGGVNYRLAVSGF